MKKLMDAATVLAAMELLLHRYIRAINASRNRDWFDWQTALAISAQQLKARLKC
jgi:hypothetical protein